jgi:hypothetical protein
MALSWLLSLGWPLSTGWPPNVVVLAARTRAGWPLSLGWAAAGLGVAGCGLLLMGESVLDPKASIELFLLPIFFFTPFVVYTKTSEASKISDAAMNEWVEGGEARHERRQQNKRGELPAGTSSGSK